MGHDEGTLQIPTSFTIRGSLRVGLPMLLIPPTLLIIILISGNFFLLDYIHILSGLTWTGMDLILGLFFSNVMRGLSNEGRARVAMRLTPTMLFFMPSITTVTTTAGVFLAIRDGFFSPVSPIIVVVLIIVTILTAIGLGVFLPNELRIYLELIKTGQRDIGKVIRLTMLNLRISLFILVFQVVIIFLMAQLATGIYI
ncbi:MAG: hypothetical protein JRN19_02610 [Nitrososphaerota archaeon]|nr:hypothetical protein [Nitrososphaerota archaeon]MDG7051326.1 hypothetical protein [Nitrososphaerota archaeon]